MCIGRQIKVKCDYCGKSVKKYVGHVNRAKKLGAKLFCGKKCFGLNRRTNETAEEKKLIKYLYDTLLIYGDGEGKRLSSKIWFRKDYDSNPKKYKKRREKKQEYHNEYCRQPGYKKKKKRYDQQYRAKKSYGIYWESLVALLALQEVVNNRAAKRDQKIYNKSQKRKRNAKQNIKRKEFESCTMGLYQQR